MKLNFLQEIWPRAILKVTMCVIILWHRSSNLGDECMLLVMDSTTFQPCDLSWSTYVPWFIYAAGPSQSCDKFFLQENMMLKSFSPGRSNFFSSSSVISAMHPQRNGNLSPLLLQKIKGQIQYCFVTVTINVEKHCFKRAFLFITTAKWDNLKE